MYASVPEGEGVRADRRESNGWDRGTNQRTASAQVVGCDQNNDGFVDAWGAVNASIEVCMYGAREGDVTAIRASKCTCGACWGGNNDAVSKCGGEKLAIDQNFCEFEAARN